jgi:tetratricopeptide (TPR) repeat protein
LTIVLISCDTFQTGQQLYKSGLDHFKSADHGDYHDHDGLSKAILDFEKSIDKGFKERDVFDKLTWSYLLLNSDNQNAERVYSLGLQTFPNDIEFYFRRGGCRKELKKHKQALDDFNQAILLDTTRKYEYINNAFYDRGAMRYILGDTINADKDREIAKSITDHELRTYQDYCQLWK